MTSLAQPGPLGALDMDSPRCQVPLEKNPACSSWEQDLHPPLYCLCPRTAVPLPPPQLVLLVLRLILYGRLSSISPEWVLGALYGSWIEEESALQQRNYASVHPSLCICLRAGLGHIQDWGSS